MIDLFAQLRGVIYRALCQLKSGRIDVGKGMKIYRKLSIVGPGRVSIGNGCIIAGVRGDKSQYVTIDTHGPEAVISIGNNATLCAARISARFQITIGNDAVIEESGVVDTDFHSIGKTRELPKSESLEKSRIVIGDRVCIGARSIVTKGVIIGDDVAIAPGSVVTASLRSGCFAMGNPARPMKDT